MTPPPSSYGGTAPENNPDPETSVSDTNQFAGDGA